MSKKMLYILNIANRVNSFSYTSMLAAQELGFEYHIAGNWSYQNDSERQKDEIKYGVHIHQIGFIRAPYHPGNIEAYHQLVQIAEREQFDVIHCNTPIGGVAGRLLGRRFHTPTVIYQAHGFHFYKGAPLLNWLIFYPVEKWLARDTDALITINQEDFKRAQSFRLRNNGEVFYVPGVGIDRTRYMRDDEKRKRKREELGLKENSIMVISAGDLVGRKNYEVSLRAVAAAKRADMEYYICGSGPREKRLKNLAVRLGIGNRVHFLGYRTDMLELWNAADIFLFSSLQEGLSRSLCEAMASSLPCVVSDIRGNVDLIKDGVGGFFCKAEDENDFAQRLRLLADDPTLRDSMGRSNFSRLDAFSINNSKEAMKKVYLACMTEKANTK